MRNRGFIKIPKDLIFDKNFVKLSNSAKMMLIYLLVLSNTFRSTTFFQYHSELFDYFKISRVHLWRILQELEIIKIKAKSVNKRYFFDLKCFYKRYSEMNNFVT